MMISLSKYSFQDHHKKPRGGGNTLSDSAVDLHVTYVSRSRTSVAHFLLISSMISLDAGYTSGSCKAFVSAVGLTKSSALW